MNSYYLDGIVGTPLHISEQIQNFNQLFNKSNNSVRNHSSITSAPCKFGIGSLFSGEKQVKFHEILFVGGEIGETPLHISARIEEARGEKCTKMLLKSGADTNLAMTDGRTPLHIAAECGSLGKCSI